MDSSDIRILSAGTALPGSPVDNDLMVMSTATRPC